MAVKMHPLCTAATLRELANIRVDEDLVARLESSFRRLSASGNGLVERFYARLFSAHPELRAMFPADMTNQKRKVSDTLGAVFSNLSAPQPTRSRLEQLGRSHVGYGTKPEHYPFVVEALVGAISDLAGENWTPALAADWTCAIGLVAEIMLEAARTLPPAAA